MLLPHYISLRPDNSFIIIIIIILKPFLRETKYKLFLLSALNNHPIYNTCTHNKEGKVELTEKHRAKINQKDFKPPQR